MLPAPPKAFLFVRADEILATSNNFYTNGWKFNQLRIISTRPPRIIRNRPPLLRLMLVIEVLVHGLDKVVQVVWSEFDRDDVAASFVFNTFALMTQHILNK